MVKDTLFSLCGRLRTVVPIFFSKPCFAAITVTAMGEPGHTARWEAEEGKALSF